MKSSSVFIIIVLKDPHLTIIFLICVYRDPNHLRKRKTLKEPSNKLQMGQTARHSGDATLCYAAVLPSRRVASVRHRDVNTKKAVILRRNKKSIQIEIIWGVCCAAQSVTSVFGKVILLELLNGTCVALIWVFWFYCLSWSIRKLCP